MPCGGGYKMDNYDASFSAKMAESEQNTMQEEVSPKSVKDGDQTEIASGLNRIGIAIEQLKEAFLAFLSARQQAPVEAQPSPASPGMQRSQGSMQHEESEDPQLTASDFSFIEKVADAVYGKFPKDSGLINLQSELAKLDESVVKKADLVQIRENLENLPATLTGRVEELFADNLTLPIVGSVKSIVHTILTQISPLEDRLNRLDESLKDNSYGEKLDTLGGQVDSIKGTLETINNHLEEYKEKYKKLEASLAPLRQENEQLRDTKRQLEIDLASANAELRKKESELASASAELTRSNSANKVLEERLSHRQTELDKERITSASLRDDKDSLEERLRQAQGALSLVESESGALKAKAERFNNWEEAARIYDNARKKLAACDLFCEIARRHGMHPDGEEGLINTMKRMGGRDILDEMHAAARDEKEKSGQPVSDAEKEAYAAVNECYRDAWNIDFDVFELPGKQDMRGKFQKCDFVKGDVLDIKFPRDKYDFAAEVYVPILRTPTGQVAQPGRVKGTH